MFSFFHIVICASSEAVYEKPNLVCPNDHCGGTASKALHDSIKRLGIEGIGPATVNDLVTKGIKNILNVFDMGYEDWVSLPGFAPVSANAALAEIVGVQTSPIDDYKVLAALNLQGIGLTLSRKILAKYSIPELKLMTDTEIAEIDNMGLVRSRLLYSGLSSHMFNSLLAKLDIIVTKGVAEMKLVCFTGKSSTSRNEWVKLAKDKGYLFNSSVTKKLSLLVCADVDSNSTKMKKVHKYNKENNKIVIMTYDEFFKLKT